MAFRCVFDLIPCTHSPADAYGNAELMSASSAGYHEILACSIVQIHHHAHAEDCAGMTAQRNFIHRRTGFIEGATSKTHDRTYAVYAYVGGDSMSFCLTFASRPIHKLAGTLLVFPVCSQTHYTTCWIEGIRYRECLKKQCRHDHPYSGTHDDKFVYDTVGLAVV